jgi:hypothetical protein
MNLTGFPMQYWLRLSGEIHEQLKQHLFPGDGKEAVAIVLCGRHEKNDVSILLSHKLLLIPYSECVRDQDYLNWKTEQIVPYLEEASSKNFAILKIHSHPGGYGRFSALDDKADNELFSSIYGWCESESMHGSAIMLPGGRIFGRVFLPDLSTRSFDKVSIAGDVIHIWKKKKESVVDAFSISAIQAFGEGTYSKLKGMTVGVIGCSGTGSPTIEQLVRLGVGSLILVDPDIVEERNLNRILNSRMSHVNKRVKKTVMFAEVIKQIGLGTMVSTYAVNLYDSIEALQALVRCDVIFGCVDSVDGRYLLSQLVNFYLIPYFDMGVGLKADQVGGISVACVSVNYIQPGMSSLITRGMFNMDSVIAEGLRRQNPAEYEHLKRQKYIKDVEVERPAVISINMLASSLGINEFLNRVHPYREEGPHSFARVMVDLCSHSLTNEKEGSFQRDLYNSQNTGHGDCMPLLRMPELKR